MGGPNPSSQNNVANSQQNSANLYSQLSQQSLAKQDALYQPAISYNTGLVNAANSGDYSQLIQAAGPQLGTISQNFQQAKQNIGNTVAPGAGAQAAQAMLPGQQAGAIASTLNQSYTGALNNLSQLGAAYGGESLQFAGAGLSGLAGASNTYGNVANQEAQGKSSTMNLLGSLAGGLGTAAGGGVFGKL